ncbi:NADH-quinone oxidoreductase subunit NuoE [bacterium]|nr:NADH-quinone oxidoreductase subunit NuoE [bacterium]
MSPEYSDQTKKKVEEVISHYPKKEAALLPVLHLTQREFGKISKEEEALVADFLNIKPIQVREAVTFYSMIHQKEMGKYHIQVCRNLSCTLMGAGTLIDYLKDKLNIEPGETTPDHKFSLSTVECLGACEQAPCMMVNFDYYGHLDKKKIDQILDDLE